MAISFGPMVETKYPRSHRVPLGNFFVFFLSHADDLPFMIAMAYETEYLGGMMILLRFTRDALNARTG